MTRTTEYRYNVDGLLEELVCRNGEEEQVTRWEYGVELDGDDEGVSRNDLVRAKVYPDGGGDRVEYTYNRLGEVATFTDQNGTVHKYDRDVLGRLKEDVVTLDEEGPVEVDDGVLAIGVSYTARGEVEAVTSYSDAGMVTVANEVKYEYNGFGQVTKEYQAHGSAVDPETSPKVSYDYENGTNNSIRRTQVQYPNGRLIDLQYSGVIDERMDRVSKLVDLAPNPDEDIATYAWLGAGTVVKTGYPEPELEMTVVKASSTAPDGDAGDQYTGLDRFGRLEDARWRKTGGSMNSRVRVQYGFDRVGNRTWRRDLEPNSELFDEHYGYDGLYQVTALNRGNLNQNRTAIGGVPTWAEAWNYDEMGNWLGYTNAVDGAASLDQARLYNAGNELLAINGTNATVAHDPAGNMTRMPAVGDWENGTALVGQTLKWDAWNRLVEITVTDGGALVGGYQYDGLNRRITKDDGATLRHFYYSDQWQVLEERTGTSTTAERQFVWGIKGIDDLIYRETFGTGAARLYALSDGKNVVAITNTSGAVQERYVYTAFGQPTVLESDFEPVSPTVGWETLYCGYRWDDESGLYQVRYRYYHPELGRWLSRDPIGEVGGLNTFSYVFNTPNRWKDSFGLAVDNDLAQAIHDGGVKDTQASEAFRKRRGYHIEYCGLVCGQKDCSGKWAYQITGPIQGGPGWCKPWDAPCPEGWAQKGVHHSHPAGSPNPSAPKTSIRGGKGDTGLADSGHWPTDPKDPKKLEAGLPFGATSPEFENYSTRIYDPSSQRTFQGPKTPIAK